MAPFQETSWLADVELLTHIYIYNNLQKAYNIVLNNNVRI